MTGGGELAASAKREEFLSAFERFFASFRQQVDTCFGDKSGDVLARAEEKVRLRKPGFNLTFSDPGSVLPVLDLIEIITTEASIFKRSKLRQAALTHASELYTRHYDILREFQAIGALERFYCRLKK